MGRWCTWLSALSRERLCHSSGERRSNDAAALSLTTRLGYRAAARTTLPLKRCCGTRLRYATPRVAARGHAGSPWDALGLGRGRTMLPLKRCCGAKLCYARPRRKSLGGAGRRWAEGCGLGGLTFLRTSVRKVMRSWLLRWRVAGGLTLPLPQIRSGATLRRSAISDLPDNCRQRQILK